MDGRPSPMSMGEIGVPGAAEVPLPRFLRPPVPESAPRRVPDSSSDEAEDILQCFKELIGRVGGPEDCGRAHAEATWETGCEQAATDVEKGHHFPG
mmetsp:Transcript_41244/g.96224  ORF Transcript_41244/g.96224 Transcript_41244/m.96224 type:complete len:96 (+) Transcript_41244:36-323(+)